MSDAYEIVYFRGKKMDRMTAQALAKMEDKLGYDLTVVQGCYNRGGVAASAGTHDGGGAVDLTAYDWQRKVRIGRSLGWAMWYRSAAEGPWSAHIHGILIGNKKVSAGAARQISSYKDGRNGLANNAYDSFWRPKPIPTYRYWIEPYVAVSLSKLRVDFLNALDGGYNKPTRRGRIVQRRLNKKKLGNRRLLVDGIIGRVTIEEWARWERSIGISGRPRVPDRKSLKRLLQGSINFMVN